MPQQQPRLFHLQRDHDITGVSGVGTVADGVLWPDGTASVRWRSDHPSIVFWDRGAASVKHVHGHGGATRIVLADDPSARLARIAEAHTKHVTVGGLTSGDCDECGQPWPCPTWTWATSDRDPLATWDPADDEASASDAPPDTPRGRQTRSGAENDAQGVRSREHTPRGRVANPVDNPDEDPIFHDLMRENERLAAEVEALRANYQPMAADALNHKTCHMQLGAVLRRAEQAEQRERELRQQLTEAEAGITAAIRHRKHAEDRARLAGAAVARVRQLAAAMRTWCAPHGAASTYAQHIEDALNGQAAGYDQAEAAENVEAYNALVNGEDHL